MAKASILLMVLATSTISCFVNTTTATTTTTAVTTTTTATTGGEEPQGPQLFDHEDLCDVDERIKNGCSREIGSAGDETAVRSLAECAAKCAENTSCIGASVMTVTSKTGRRRCFLHDDCHPRVVGCTVKEKHHRYLSKSCTHGSWSVSDQSCHCPNGFYGERCSKYFTDCTDLLEAGYKEMATHYVYLFPGNDSSKPAVRVRCSLFPGYTMVLLLENWGENDFNKTWTEYVNGFSFDEGNYWAGLYPWYRMQEIGYTHLTYFFTLPDWKRGSTLLRNYYGVTLTDQENKYRLTVENNWENKQGSSPPPAGSFFGDCLGPVQNVAFSTFDADNDELAQDNCAAIAGSGWWYTTSGGSCGNPCNALGFEPKYVSVLPRQQVMSLSGLDMNVVSDQRAKFGAYIDRP